MGMKLHVADLVSFLGHTSQSRKYRRALKHFLYKIQHSSVEGQLPKVSLIFCVLFLRMEQVMILYLVSASTVICVMRIYGRRVV